MDAMYTVSPPTLSNVVRTRHVGHHSTFLRAINLYQPSLSGSSGSGSMPPSELCTPNDDGSGTIPSEGFFSKCCLRVWRICSPLLGRSMASPKPSMTRTEALL